MGIPSCRSRIVILMTACVRPDGMIYTALQDPQIRAKQYLDSIEFYLRETDYDIIFCENSGINLLDEISCPQKETRLEYLTFYGNDYNKEYGKGYGEAKIIQYAIQHSQFLKKSSFIIKITGRIKVLNINDIDRILHGMTMDEDIIGVDFSSDMGRISSVCFLSSKIWLEQVMTKYGELIRDDGALNFEGALYKAIVESPKLKIFRFNPRLDGVSAGFNIPYRNRSEIVHKCCHYHILCSIYKARKDIWNLSWNLTVLAYYSVVRRFLDIFRCKTVG